MFDSSTNYYAQNIVTPAPKGYDVFRESMPHGDIDSITNKSSTVGTTRKALVYTPPGFSKDKVPLSIQPLKFFMVWV